MCTGIEIAAIVGLAVSTVSTGVALAKGGPDLPSVPKPPPPPAPPPAPAPLPPPPTEGDAGLAEDRRKRAKRFGVGQTLLTNPLGTSTGGPPGKTLLGG